MEGSTRKANSSSVVQLPRVMGRRRRKTLMDTEKLIPTSQYKDQLTNTSDILGVFEVAPRTKRAMYLAAYDSIGKFFSNPGRTIPSPAISPMFKRNLTLRVELYPDAEVVLPALDPELQLPNNVLTYTEERNIEWDKHYATNRKSGSFDRLVQGMCKFKHKTQTPYSRRWRKAPKNTKSADQTQLAFIEQTVPGVNVKEEHLSTLLPNDDIKHEPTLDLSMNSEEIQESSLPAETPYSGVRPGDQSVSTHLITTEAQVPHKTETFTDYFVISSEDGFHYVEDVPPDLGDGDLREGEATTSNDEMPTKFLPEEQEPSEDFFPKLDLSLKSDCDQRTPEEDQLYLEPEAGSDNGDIFHVNGPDSREGMCYYTPNACTSEVVLIENDTTEISDENATPVQFFVYMP